MSPMIVGMLCVVTFTISAWLTHWFCNPASIAYVLDHPNERSLHNRAVPRGGGLAILSAILTAGIGVSWFYSDSAFSFASLAASVILVSGISFLDDHRSVPPLGRLFVHVLAVALILYQGYAPDSLALPGISLHPANSIVMVLFLLFGVWLMNLYNFMDGMDGFAGGMAVFGFGAFALMGWLAGHELFFIMNLIVVAAAAGFLVFNFPPARIFMGDVGSSTLGFLAAAFSLWGARDGVFPFWIALLVFSPFIVDATVTLLRRLWRREKVWQAHKTHFYQRLVQAGWGHRKTVLAEYVLMAACGVSAIWIERQSFVIQWSALVLWGVAYVFLALLITDIVRRKKHATQD